MKKALIITYYWPPAGGSGVQRWLKFVKYFRNFNIEPVVYTVKNAKYPITDISLENDIPKGIEVLQQSIFEPNNLFYFSNKNKKVSAGFLNAKPSFLGKIMQFIRANYFIPDARKFWIKPSVKYLKKYLSENKIDVLITTGPPHSTHLIGLRLKKETKIKWIADFRDPWTEIDYFHKLPLTKRALQKHKKLEKKVLGTADAVVVVGKTMQEKFKKQTKLCKVITNGYDTEKENATPVLDKKFTLTHVGMLNADRNHKALWKAVAHLCNSNKEFSEKFVLQLVGKIDGSIFNSMKKYKLEKNVKVINYLPHKEVLNIQKQSQVLLLLVNNVPSAKGILTGKIFEYLLAKRPILAIAPTNGDLAEIINKTNAGSTVDFKEEAEIKRILLAYFKKYKEENLKVASKNIEKYHRKELTQQFSELIYNVVK